MPLHVGDQGLGGAVEGLDLGGGELSWGAIDPQLPAGALPQQLGAGDHCPQGLFEGSAGGAVGEVAHQAAGVGEVLAGGVLDAGEGLGGLGVGAASPPAEQDDGVQALGEGVVDVLGEALALLGDALAALGVGELALGGAQLGDQLPVAVGLDQQPTVDRVGDQREDGSDQRAEYLADPQGPLLALRS